MEKKTYTTYYGGKLMEWGRGTVVKDAKGFVFLGGAGGIDPETGEVVEGAEAQTKIALEKIKSNLEEMGSSLYNIVKMIFYVAGEFPEGVGASDSWAKIHRVKEQFWREHAPELCADNNPPTFDLVGVTALGKKEMIVEIAVTAVLSDT